MLTYPSIDPIAVSLGPLKIHWYGLMYVFGFSAAWLLARYRAKTINLSHEQIDDLIFYVALGCVIGGRVGFMLFYNFTGFIHDPLSLFKIWQGGMSFHGGLLGAFIVQILLARRHGLGLFDLTDFVGPLVPIGLFLGRIGNFINGELWGRITDVPWAMVFPRAGSQPRHPSQLYEAFLEGIVLFIIMWLYTRKPRPRMAPTGLALFLYGSFRFIVEFIREPDGYVDFLYFDWVTIGQALSLPMILIGALLIVLAYKRQSRHAAVS